MENVADHLFRRRAQNLSPKALAAVFDRLIWTMDDNGEEIIQTMERWLASGEIEQVHIALSISEVFLFPTREAMVSAFDALCNRFPECRRDCNEIISRWDKQSPITAAAIAPQLPQ